MGSNRREVELMSLKQFLFLGVASLIPSIGYVVDRHFMRPKLGPVMFLLCCIATYTLFLVSLVMTDVWMSDSLELAVAELSPADKAKLRATHPIFAAWESGYVRGVAPLVGLVAVPIWCALGYFSAWLTHATKVLGCWELAYICLG